jgi:hypothetical protein
MAVVYTVGDFTVTELGPPVLFSLSSERVGSGPYLAYCDNREAAERKGRNLAQRYGVSLWKAAASHPDSRILIASYRRT